MSNEQKVTQMTNRIAELEAQLSRTEENRDHFVERCKEAERVATARLDTIRGDRKQIADLKAERNALIEERDLLRDESCGLKMVADQHRNSLRLIGEALGVGEVEGDPYNEIAPALAALRAERDEAHEAAKRDAFYSQYCEAQMNKERARAKRHEAFLVQSGIFAIISTGTLTWLACYYFGGGK